MSSKVEGLGEYTKGKVNRSPLPRVIHKFRFKDMTHDDKSNEWFLSLNSEHHILRVDNDPNPENGIVVWIMLQLDTEQPHMELVKFTFILTGQEFDKRETGQYINTFFSGAFVIHAMAEVVDEVFAS